ncbi:MAG TPA: SGNH/GDSL hydrolase family protein [Gemmataceae bacterium]|jgi:lysophospholipase L1-like esterase|nr:SGNH/GDSL hydrolase family protein [Gemmataceae bacterium]
MTRISAIVVTLLVLAPAGRVHAKPGSDFFFKKGDRIVFLGDSITEQYQYSTYLELYLTTRFPAWHLTFLNAGIGGDTATGGAGRFAAHVLAEKPTAVTIDFGMNDGGYGGFDEAGHAAYVKNTRAMLEAAKKAGVRVALISPNAVDRRVNPGLKLYFETQKQFYAALKELAAEYKLPFVDQYAVTRAALEQMEKDHDSGVKPFPDGVHTSPQGALLMAHTILVGLHAPAGVSKVDIDVATGKAKTQACSVNDLRASTDGVAFERTDEALPLPVQPEWLPILSYVKHLQDLNWYGLKVTGLAAGKYALQIDGKEVASFSAEELAKGVNLGTLTTGAVHDQGQKVFKAINAKNELLHHRFRDVVMFQAPDWLADVAAERRPAELAKRMKQIDARQQKIDELARPVSHRFELKAAK